MVDVNDVHSVADGILMLLRDDTLFRQIGSEACQRIEATRGYDYQMSKMERIYERVLAEK